MDNIEDIITSIRGLVRSIPRDIGMYASLSEGIEPSGETLVNVYLDEPAGPRTLQASTEPQDDELSLAGLRDALLEWIMERRRRHETSVDGGSVSRWILVLRRQFKCT